MPLPPQLQVILSRNGHLGWISPKKRNATQHAANARHVARMITVPSMPRLSGPVRVDLFKAWSDPLVVKDVGFVFPRFHQLTGSCVGAGGGQALFTLQAVQRLLATNPTTAFLPFWPYNYGKCRYEEGDHGQGEGAMGSSFAGSVNTDGVIDSKNQGLPQFQNNDGLVLTSQLEMAWSDGGSSLVTAFDPIAKPHPVGNAAPCKSSQDIKAGLLNGQPATFACDNYIGNASVQGSGADAAVVGYWDESGGHQQSVHAYWDNATLGPLYWVQNNWPGSTYPSDPAGGPVCGCWVTEAKVDSAIKNLDAEVYTLSHLNWTPAPQTILDWSSAFWPG